MTFGIIFYMFCWFLVRSPFQLVDPVAISIACAIFFPIWNILCSWGLSVSRNVMISTAMAVIVFGSTCIVFAFFTVPFVVVLGMSWVFTSSVASHPKSGILLSGMAFLPCLTFPICSSSYSWHTFLGIGIFLTSQQCTFVVWLWLSFISTWIFPRSPVMQKSLYLGWNALDVWSLTSMLSPIFNCSGSFRVLCFLFPSLAFLASFRLWATIRYSFDIRSMLIMPLSVPKYLGFSDSSRLCFTAASLPNMRKNGAMPDDSVGKKLYAAVAFQTRSSHFTRFSNCFAIVAFRNLWNPSILPLHWGE